MVDIRRAVLPHPRHIEALDDVQGEKVLDAAARRGRAIDIVAAIGGMERFDPPRLEIVQVEDCGLDPRAP